MTGPHNRSAWERGEPGSPILTTVRDLLRRQFPHAWTASISEAAVFALAMTVGGWLLCRQLGLDGAWELLTADLVDPRPERVKYVVRALFLVWVYGWGIASDVVAKGGADKKESEDVTRAMTRSVIACTLWVVAWELATAVVVLAGV